MFIKTFISFVYRDLLLKEILDAFTEINHFLENFTLTSCISNT